MNNTSSIYLPKLYHSFADEQNVYIILEYVPCGTMADFINGVFEIGFDATVVQFYAA